LAEPFEPAEDEAMTYQSINPFDGKTLKTFENHTDTQLEAALVTAAACFETWRRKSFAERAAVLTKAASIMRSRVDEFARPVTFEMGKLIEESRGEVKLSADIIEYYAQNGERFLATEHLTPNLGEATIESSPIGVLFGVEP
jgi:succinate-semialdehyde dehydrogenase / glutarate-semialdehyde dehydrogenase